MPKHAQLALFRLRAYTITYNMETSDFIGLVIVAVTVLANISLATIVLLHDIKAQVNRAFFMFIVLLSLWVLVSFLWTVTIFPLWLLNIFLRLDFLFATLAVFGFLLFAYLFPVRSKNLSVGLIMGAFVLVLAVSYIAVFTNLIIQSTHLESYSLSYSPGPLDIPYAMFVFVYLCFSISLLRTKYSFLDGLEKKQVASVLWGATISSFIIVLTSLILWRIFNYLSITQQYSVELIPNLGRFSTVVFTIASTYAILKYRLFGIRTVIGKIIVWIGIATFFLAGFYLVVGVEQLLRVDIFSPFAIFMNVLVSIMFAMIFSIYDRQLQSFVSKKVNMVSYDIEELKVDFQEQVSHFSENEKKIVFFSNYVADIFKVKKIGLWVYGENLTTPLLFWRGFSHDQQVLLEREEVMNELITVLSAGIMHQKEFSVFDQQISAILRTSQVETIVVACKEGLEFVLLFGGFHKDSQPTEEFFADIQSLASELLRQIEE